MRPGRWVPRTRTPSQDARVCEQVKRDCQRKGVTRIEDCRRATRGWAAEHRGATVQRIAISGDRNITRAFEIQRDLIRVASRRNFEVIFELILISIKGEIDTGINLTVLNPSKLRTGLIRC